MISTFPKKQMIVFALLLAFVVLFFIYFYRAALSDEFLGSNAQTSGGGGKKFFGDLKINLDLFSSDKFKNLRFDSLPVVTFPVGKRNPFEPD